MNIQASDLVPLVKEAAKLFENRNAASAIRVKGVADFVTAVDTSVQAMIQQDLQQRYPDIQFLGEEKDNSAINRKGTYWVLDPVDGTTNLIHDYHASVISLALMVEGVPSVGIIYDPYTKELFTAERGHGAFLNGEPIHVSKAQKMCECLIAFGPTPYRKELADQTFAMLKNVFLDVHDIRRSGSAALDLAYTACGRADGFFERELHLWDFAAGMLLVREAGGVVTDYSGATLDVPLVSDVCAANPAIQHLLVSQYLQP